MRTLILILFSLFSWLHNNVKVAVGGFVILFAGYYLWFCHAYSIVKLITYFCYLFIMQFYTFLETSLVTLSLFPHFLAFFSDGEIPGTPGMLATTFLAFGKV